MHYEIHYQTQGYASAKQFTKQTKSGSRSKEKKEMVESKNYKSYRESYHPKDIVKVYNFCETCKKQWYNSTDMGFIRCPLCTSYEITTRIDNTNGQLQIPYFRGEDYSSYAVG